MHLTKEVQIAEMGSCDLVTGQPLLLIECPSKNDAPFCVCDLSNPVSSFTNFMKKERTKTKGTSEENSVVVICLQRWGVPSIHLPAIPPFLCHSSFPPSGDPPLNMEGLGSKPDPKRFIMYFKLKIMPMVTVTQNQQSTTYLCLIVSK